MHTKKEAMARVIVHFKTSVRLAIITLHRSELDACRAKTTGIEVDQSYQLLRDAMMASLTDKHEGLKELLEYLIKDFDTDMPYTRLYESGNYMVMQREDALYLKLVTPKLITGIEDMDDGDTYIVTDNIRLD